MNKILPSNLLYYLFVALFGLKNCLRLLWSFLRKEEKDLDANNQKLICIRFLIMVLDKWE